LQQLQAAQACRRPPLPTSRPRAIATAAKPSARAKATPLVVLALDSSSPVLKYSLHALAGGRVETMLSGQAPSLDQVAAALDGPGIKAPQAVGHLIVHGGPLLRTHCLIDAHTQAQLQAASAFAPLPAQAAVAALAWAQARYPGLPQVACIDNAFHDTLPDLARVLPLPHGLLAEGVMRYGFHGLSCESIVQQLAPKVPARLVIAHLGHRSSVTAVKAGRSVDTSMGLTPGGGVVMGTQAGDIDPGVLLYLLREKRLDAAALANLLETQSGLLGISGLSGDMRVLHAAAATAPRAALAIALFCQSVAKQVAGMVAVLEGLDLLVFTGGIGENDAAVRAAVCKGLRWSNIRVDAARNSRADSVAIQEAASRCEVQVRPSQEAEQIARHVGALLRPAPGVSPPA
jgi:acetate kinase